MDKILSECPLDMVEHHRHMSAYNARDANQQLGEINLKRLVKLHATIKEQASEHRRSLCRWNMLVEEALFMENVVQSYSRSDKKLIGRSQKKHCDQVLSVLEWVWHTRLSPMISRILSLICVCMSILIVLGQSSLFLSLPIGLFPLLFEDFQGIVQTQLYCLIPLTFIMGCTKFGVFNLKLNGWYGLYPHNQTDPSNMVWSAFYIARLTAPLAYNFLLFVKVEGTQFSKVMGVIDIVPILGNHFALFFPLALILMCMLNYFNIYGRFMTYIGLNRLSFQDKYNQQKVQEGKALIARSKNQIKTQSKMSSEVEMPSDSKRNVKLIRPFNLQIG